MVYEQKIRRAMMQNKALFSEFIACFINRGLANLICDYHESGAFSFRRTNIALGLDELFLYSNSEEYIRKKIADNADANVIYILFPEKGLHYFDCYQASWKVSTRKQFSSFCGVKNCAASVRKLSMHDEPLIAQSASETVKQNYQLAMELGEDCYAISDADKLVCFLSISKLCDQKIAEIAWIYTEEKYRQQGFATTLLSTVATILFHEGYLSTYHCSEANIASEHTALRAEFVKEENEIVLEKLC